VFVTLPVNPDGLGQYDVLGHVQAVNLDDEIALGEVAG
jgi:hypothetical protein